ncbi:MAG: hypothetical protein GF330_09025 [Candidatus Eisenbacteria bacterium]|nr:hypothetical protein [Candidatus Eisenbacteria bacterium]
MARKTVLIALMIALTASLAAAGGGQKWLHVRVDEGGEDGERVFVNLPLDLVEAVLPHVSVENFDRGKVRVDIDEIEDVDLHAIWEAVREAEDGEYVTVEGADENVRIAKEGAHLVVRVDEEDEKVDIKIRVAVLDAMMAGEKDELDLLAALEVLGEQDDCELITVQDGEERVRIWIDSQKSGSE